MSTVNGKEREEQKENWGGEEERGESVTAKIQVQMQKNATTPKLKKNK